MTDVADYMIVISEGRVTFAGAPGELPNFATGKAFEFAGRLEMAQLEPMLSRLPEAKLIDHGTTRMLLHQRVSGRESGSQSADRAWRNDPLLPRCESLPAMAARTPSR